MTKYLLSFLCLSSSLFATSPIETIKCYQYMAETNLNSVKEEINNPSIHYDSKSYQALIDQQNILTGNLQAFYMCLEVLEE